jgi:hypothetical protein
MSRQIFIKIAVLGTFLTISACATGLSKVDYPAGTDPQAKLNELQLRLDGDQTSESVLEDAGYAAAQLQEAEENAQQQQHTKEKLSASL